MNDVKLIPTSSRTPIRISVAPNAYTPDSLASPTPRQTLDSEVHLNESV